MCRIRTWGGLFSALGEPARAPNLEFFFFPEIREVLAGRPVELDEDVPHRRRKYLFHHWVERNRRRAALKLPPASHFLFFSFLFSSGALPRVRGWGDEKLLAMPAVADQMPPAQRRASSPPPTIRQRFCLRSEPKILSAPPASTRHSLPRRRPRGPCRFFRWRTRLATKKKAAGVSLPFQRPPQRARGEPAPTGVASLLTGSKNFASPEDHRVPRPLDGPHGEKPRARWRSAPGLVPGRRQGERSGARATHENSARTIGSAGSDRSRPGFRSPARPGFERRFGRVDILKVPLAHAPPPGGNPPFRAHRAATVRGKKKKIPSCSPPPQIGSVLVTSRPTELNSIAASLFTSRLMRFLLLPSIIEIRMNANRLLVPPRVTRIAKRAEDRKYARPCLSDAQPPPTGLAQTNAE